MRSMATVDLAPLSDEARSSCGRAFQCSGAPHRMVTHPRGATTAAQYVTTSHSGSGPLQVTASFRLGRFESPSGITLSCRGLGEGAQCMSMETYLVD